MTHRLCYKHKPTKRTKKIETIFGVATIPLSGFVGKKLISNYDKLICRRR